MTTHRGPRIGRPDRLATLHAQREAEDALSLPVGLPAATRLLMQPPPVAPASEPPPRWKDVREAAARLAEQLRPLPAALSELGVKISRQRAAAAGRDALQARTEIARAAELLRGRTFDLFLAIHKLAEAARGKEGA